MVAGAGTNSSVLSIGYILLWLLIGCRIRGLDGLSGALRFAAEGCEARGELMHVHMSYI